MLDLDRLRRITLSANPPGQRVMANAILSPNFRLRGTRVVLEGIENLPGGPVAFAMNHTDRYNYWPFQWELYRRKLGFTVTWVKGKYYENAFVGWFMDHCNNIPLPSRGYVIATEFRARTGRVPSRDEYRILRDIVNEVRTLDEPLPEGKFDDLKGFLAEGNFHDDFEALFNAMMREVTRLSETAFHELANHLLVFPQGTRSLRLTRGHTGLVQMAQYLGASVVPVGCNGSDKLYPGNSPFAKGGTVTYRIGKPLPVDGPEFAPYRVDDGSLPFSRAATANHGDAYRAMTDIIMDRINDLLDPEYQRQLGVEAETEAVSRFIE